MEAPIVPRRRGRPGTWLRGRATPAGADRVHARRWAILAVLCLSVFLALVDNTIVNVALPSISKQLHATTSGSLIARPGCRPGDGS